MIEHSEWSKNNSSESSCTVSPGQRFFPGELCNMST